MVDIISAVAAGGQVLGGLGSLMSAGKKSVSWRRMRQIQQDQQQWQERMSNTALQRQMKDAKKAGINPMYLANSSGAPMPQAVSSGLSTEYPDYGQIIQTMASALQDIKFKKEQIKTEKKIQKKTEAETNKINQDIAINSPEQEYKGTFGIFLKAIKNKFNLNTAQDASNLINKIENLSKKGFNKIKSSNKNIFESNQQMIKENDIKYYKRIGLSADEIKRLYKIKDRNERNKTASFLYNRRLKIRKREIKNKYYQHHS